MQELSTLIDRHCPLENTETAIPRLTLRRSDCTTDPTWNTAPPMFCVVAQGRKRIFLGEEEFFYDPKTYLVTTADLPCHGHIMEAPYLGLTMELSQPLLADLVLEMERTPTELAASRAMAVDALEGDLLDSLLRLLRLLDQPRHIKTLAPLIEREIHYRLLLGSRGEMLRQLAMPTSQFSHINRTITFIQQRYQKPIRIEQLAEIASMSAPSFHRHFRSVTGMSPIQFQKRIRLQEARRRLLAENEGAASVAFEVGYESPSQFSREYRRMFGAPPSVETAPMRTAAAGV